MKYIKTTGSAFALIAIFSTAVILSGCKQPSQSSDNNQPIKIEGKQVYTDTGASSVKVFDQNGRVCIQQTNTYYDMVNYISEGKVIPLLLKVRKTDLCYADSANRQKVFEISAKSVMDTKPIAWDAKFVGTTMEFKNNSVLVTEDGGDDEDDFLQRFSLQDGKNVFSCSRGELQVAVPNVKDRRFIGYTSKQTASSPLQALNEENLLGIIRYGGGGSVANALKLKLKRSKVAIKIPQRTPDMVLVPLNDNTSVMDDGKVVILMHANTDYKPADVKDFAAKLTFYYGDDNEATDIIIPIINDKLDLANAKYDKEIFELSQL